MTIDEQVKSREITKCCWDCAEKHRTQEPYKGTYTTYIGTCQICGKEKQVTSAYKLFGYHHFL